MKYRNFIFVMAFLFTTIIGNAAVGFVQNSRLASGKWVKIEVKDRGIHVISYDQLREMGFPDPQKVGVYGKGGTMQDVNFRSNAGDIVYTDDVQPVSVVHSRDRLLFYAEGVDKLRWNENESRFVKVSKNLYSDTGVYFLSDSEKPLLSKETALNDDEAEVLNWGMDYIYHEKDLYQNDTKTGQLFWGESFLNQGNILKFKEPAALAVDGEVLLEYSFYVEPNNESKLPYTYTMSMDESEESFTQTRNKAKTSKYVAVNLMEIFDVKPKGEFNISLSTICEESSYVNLDYWMLTYPKRFPSLQETDIKTEHYLVQTKFEHNYRLNVPKGMCVWNVTDPSAPVVFFPDPYGDKQSDFDSIIFEATGDYMLLAFAYPDSNNIQTIVAWNEVENQNLHALTTENVELVIATVPEYKKYAEEIAELHRNFDDTKTIVVTTEQLYNEFSSGIPHPIAYRAFMKMLYEQGDGNIKNLLLLGPSLGDFRNPECSKTPYDIHIAFQESEPTIEDEAGVVYDFLGMLDDNVNMNALYGSTMQVGVGVLNCNNDRECRRAMRKIRSYLENRGEYVWMMNDIMTLGGEGDKHSHDWHADTFAQFIRNSTYAPYAVSNVSIDALGYEAARKKMISKLEEGKLFLIYYGHGDARMIGPNIEFFSTSDVLKLNNGHRGFMFLGGCHFSAPDRGSRGLGEDLVLSTDGGMTGGIVSTRASYSSKNWELSQKFANKWLKEDWDRFPTIGEIYARTKSKSEFNNSLFYMYAGDPALKIPVASGRIETVLKTVPVPGGMLRISGKIIDQNGSHDTNFEGKCVVKIMKPDVTLVSKDYVTNTCGASNASERDTLRIKYMAERLLAMEFNVTKGEFIAEIPVPNEFKKYVGKELGIYLSAVDPEALVGAVGHCYVPINESGESGVPVEDRDEEAPMLSISFDSTNSLLYVTASDNAGMRSSPDILKVKVDDNDVLASSMHLTNAGVITGKFEAVSDLIDLAPGKHVAAVECVDMAGNVRKVEYDFEKIENKESIYLTLSSRAVVDTLTIDLAGADGAQVELTIVDSLGNKVLQRSISGTSFEWDCRDANGVLVNPGLYRMKACTVENGSLPKYSKWETIAILQ